MTPEQLLVDVVSLSKKNCTYPIKGDLKYCTHDNLTGRPLNGYHPQAQEVCLLIRKAAEQLCVAQNSLNNSGYGLVIYDAYRPLRAVHDFVMWSQQPHISDDELEQKRKHYPNIEKNQMFALGYIAEDSRHCYGEAVDVMLIHIHTGESLDMGARFDFMDPLSHIDRTAAEIGETAFHHRKILKTAMQKSGFETYPEEFWHYNYGNPADRVIKSPMDIPITPNLKGLGII